jgi:hypothetical protein
MREAWAAGAIDEATYRDAVALMDELGGSG